MIMNYCRTCKYWSLNANMVGLGTCLNVDAMMRVNYQNSLQTSQNFGCVCHEQGECKQSIWTKEDTEKIRKEYLGVP